MPAQSPPVRFVRHLATGATFEVDLVARGDETVVEKRVTPALRHAPEAAAMLAREAAFLDAVRLPFLPRLLAHHDADPSAPQRVHETFVAGEHLDVALGHRRDVPARADVLLALVDAITALHAAGAFHGDVSPSNVLFDAGAGIGLVDFGASGTHALTADRSRGTIPYAPPEVIRGDARVGQAADRYAVAILTIEALTPGLTPAGEPAVHLRDLPEAGRLLAIGDRGVAPRASGDETMRPIETLLADMVAFREVDRPRDLGGLRAALFSLAARARKSEIDERR